MKKIQTILLEFPDIPLKYHEIEWFKSKLGKTVDLKKYGLHNRDEDNMPIHEYPKIQFRAVNGFAALWGIENGSKALMALLQDENLPSTFFTSTQTKKEWTLQINKEYYTYAIDHFLPIDTDNYQKWKKLDDLADRLELIRACIKGHILNFLKEVNFELNAYDLEIILKKYKHRPSIKLKKKEYKVLCFDITIKTNVYLPEGIGLGRHKNLGFGVLRHIQTHTEYEEA